MINIVTNKSRLNKKYIYEFEDCEVFFRAKIHSKDFGNDDIEAMQMIDNAILLDRDMGTIQTDFGITTIDNLSTGCKTVLTYLYIKRNKQNYVGEILLDVTECGSNALDVLFDLMDKYKDSDTILLLKHNNYLYKCKSHDYLLDGKEKSELF